MLLQVLDSTSNSLESRLLGTRYLQVHSTRVLKASEQKSVRWKVIFDRSSFGDSTAEKYRDLYSLPDGDRVNTLLFSSRPKLILLRRSLENSSSAWKCRISIRYEDDEVRDSSTGQGFRQIKFGDALSDPALVESTLRRAQLAILNPSVPALKFVSFDLSTIKRGKAPLGSTEQRSVRLQSTKGITLTFSLCSSFRQMWSWSRSALRRQPILLSLIFPYVLNSAQISLEPTLIDRCF